MDKSGCDGAFDFSDENVEFFSRLRRELFPKVIELDDSELDMIAAAGDVDAMRSRRDKLFDGE